MDELVKQLILGAPNLVVAVAVLLWAREHIREKEAEIKRLTDVIISMANLPVKPSSDLQEGA